MPFAATYRHEYWSVDVRYIEDHQLEQRKPVYVISVLENYSRALLASILLAAPGLDGLPGRAPAGLARAWVPQRPS